MRDPHERFVESVDIKTEPEHVERASRRERWKRQAWMIGSSLGSFLVVGWAVWQLLSLVDWHPTGTPAAFVLLSMLLVAIALSRWVFGWGVNRFDLVIPWQFRGVRAKERDQP